MVAVALPQTPLEELTFSWWQGLLTHSKTKLLFSALWALSFDPLSLTLIH